MNNIKRASTLFCACVLSVLACGAMSPPALDFRSSSWMSNRNVVNNNGEDVAKVSDLILDRGSGRIEYVVVKTGTTFGLGGRAVAIPYGSFKWELADKDRLILASTVEQLKQSPEYTAENWRAMKDPPKDDKNTLHKSMTTDTTSKDAYAGKLNTSSKSKFEGVIRKTERVRNWTNGEQVVITVEAKDGTTKRVALGPSWYVNATPAAPMRGDTVTVETFAINGDTEDMLVGSQINTDTHKLTLRDSSGRPAWALKSVESAGRQYSTPYSRYLLASDLSGMKINCRGSECGKVDDVIFERNSGEVGFISIDPNENFLGIGDKKRLAPWSVATVTVDGTLHIDADKDMVLATMETPKDLTALNNGAPVERICKAFNVATPSFEVARATSSDKVDTQRDAWNPNGPILTAIEKDSTRILTGKVTGYSEVKFNNGFHPARALKVRMGGADGNEEMVLIGPAWFMQNQKPVCESGDTVKVEACRTSVDGHKYWIAKTIDCKDTRVVILSGNNSPSWTQP